MKKRLIAMLSVVSVVLVAGCGYSKIRSAAALSTELAKEIEETEPEEVALESEEGLPESEAVETETETENSYDLKADLERLDYDIEVLGEGNDTSVVMSVDGLSPDEAASEFLSLACDLAIDGFLFRAGTESIGAVAKSSEGTVALFNVMDYDRDTREYKTSLTVLKDEYRQAFEEQYPRTDISRYDIQMNYDKEIQDIMEKADALLNQ